MAQDINNIMLVGRTTADVELKTTTSGKSVASFTLANNGYNDATNFINVVAWNKTAELLAQYAPKGKQLAITGRLTTRGYEDKDGNKRQAVEVVVEDFNFVGGGRGDDSGFSPSNSGGGRNTSSKKAESVVSEIDDKPIDLSEIPF